MPSFQDSALIFVLALILFGPKKLPELARQLGKLMGEFRRASNEFRMQMEDELRMAEQADQQKKIAAMEAAAPVTPAITDGSENTIAPPLSEDPIEEHPYMDSFKDDYSTPSIETAVEPVSEANAEPAPEPLPIATSGDLNIMPPSTGLPVASSSSISQAFSSIPRAPEPVPVSDQTTEAPVHG
ncbi:MULTISPECIES: twin-arginine translocase TatA/TatE family subunit [Acidobacteriaceae]|uniref:twin-arginine translocase TatA/TatE family subunit n=1 Tax=Acidobacteriaceae TaxID=204434 RepID=UPI00131DEDE3|nr:MULTISPECIES: twin-arginine translocase TatA/TatE family subunit [Acidobacteriaceae]MDW5264984.1 twin-arginine translocase TatA/TatE family subunit [Edaphobacter sp.]